jgi:thioester reductase-like protein
LPEEVIERVICFVRAESHEEAHRRVTQIIEKRGLTVGEKPFIALAADVSRDQLGLDVERYSDLVRSVDVVIHVTSISQPDPVPSCTRTMLIKAGSLASPLCE